MTTFTYTFNNHFHPFVGKLLKKLNRSKEPIDGLLDVNFHASLVDAFFEDAYDPNPDEASTVTVKSFPKRIDASEGGAYAVYNWELFFHIPLTIAVHLSKNQRFAEAQRWFHYIFDPTSNDKAVSAPERFWQFLPFRLEYLFTIELADPADLDAGELRRKLQDKDLELSGNLDLEEIENGRRWRLIDRARGKAYLAQIQPRDDTQISIFEEAGDVRQIDELLRILAEPLAEATDEEREVKELILSGYEEIRADPFQPHAVARTRHLAYQYCTVMKYLDNLIAWGDSLFRQDTIETINEATQLYVLTANILGPKPQRIPRQGRVKPKTFAQLRANGLDPMGNALVELEGKFPFSLSFPASEGIDTDEINPLFGIGRTLYFCIPRNDQLLRYWDVVADRLFKIRHCMNIEGVVRQLPLFQPPIDPGMLVKAAAAGIDISSLVSGLHQPLAPVRARLMIQKALEICREVRGLGASLLSALEKKDGEALSLLRQKHEINIQQMAQDVRFLQWKEAEEAIESLLKSRETTLERYKHYQRLLSKSEEDLSELESLSLERQELSEETFDEVYDELVGQYELELEMEEYPPLEIKGSSAPSTESGATGKGRLYLNSNENADLNKHAPKSRDLQIAATVTDNIFQTLAMLPEFQLDAHYWGIGASTVLAGGPIFSGAGRIISGSLNTAANIQSSKGASASKKASYERRADDWTLQSNLAARELMQIGRRIISSLIREQITRHEYETQQTQIEQAQELDRFLRDKFTNQELYGWMQGELSKLYYEYYQFAFDTARKAEQTMKHELMRPELDETDFIQFNYWDGGRKGLLSGEALHLDLKRMEMAYHEHNKREYELTKHVSLRQLDPVALLQLKATGTCEVTLPEWLFDLDGPGHYMRRIKSVSLTIPSVTGPYTSVNCTLSLLKSSLRRSSLVRDQYARQGSEDDRFVDYYGTVESVVTSGAQNDSGLFQTDLRDERYLPFEGSGVVSTWRLELPAEFRQFDYNTISDVILHVRYTARQEGAQLREKAVQHIGNLIEAAGDSGLVRLFSLKHDFPSEWHHFTASDDGEAFKATIQKAHFPYFVQDRDIEINKAELYTVRPGQIDPPTTPEIEPGLLTFDDGDEFELSLSPDDLAGKEDAHVFLLFRYAAA